MLRISAYFLIGIGVAAAVVGRLYTLHMDFWFFALAFLVPGLFASVSGVVLLVRRIWDWPNAITVGRMLLVPLVLWLLLPGYYNQQTPIIAASLYGIISLTDIIDGLLARRLGQVTVMGMFLDPLADKIVYVTVLIALIPRDLVPVWLVLVVVVRELFITGLRGLAVSEGMVIHASRGGKMKTAFGLVGVIVLLIHFTYTVDFFLFTLKLDFHAIGLALTYLSVVFSVLSAVDYIWKFGKELTRKREHHAGPAH